MSLRIMFAGTSDFSAYHLNALLTSGYNVVGVFTKPDFFSKRGKKTISNPVQRLSERYRVPVFHFLSVKIPEYYRIFKELNVDIFVVVSYGLILPKEILNLPRLGSINVHGSLLPRWRGAAPIQHSILAGDLETGVTVIKMNSGLDSGDILYKLSCQISNNDTSETLCRKLEILGRNALITTLQKIAIGKIVPENQNQSLVTYAKKINKKEAKIDWSLTAIQLDRQVRAFNPWPNSWISVKNNLIKIWKTSVIKSSLEEIPGTIVNTNKHGIQIATVKDILNIELLQPEGKKIMSAQDILNSRGDWFNIGKNLSDIS